MAGISAIGVLVIQNTSHAEDTALLETLAEQEDIGAVLLLARQRLPESICWNSSQVIAKMAEKALADLEALEESRQAERPAAGHAIGAPINPKPIAARRAQSH